MITPIEKLDFISLESILSVSEFVCFFFPSERTLFPSVFIEWCHVSRKQDLYWNSWEKMNNIQFFCIILKQTVCSCSSVGPKAYMSKHLETIYLRWAEKKMEKTHTAKMIFWNKIHNWWIWFLSSVYSFTV